MQPEEGRLFHSETSTEQDIAARHRNLLVHLIHTVRMATSWDELTTSARDHRRLLARTFRSANLNTVHYKMDTIPPAKIGHFVMRFKRDGEIDRVWFREGYMEMA